MLASDRRRCRRELLHLLSAVAGGVLGVFTASIANYNDIVGGPSLFNSSRRWESLDHADLQELLKASIKTSCAVRLYSPRDASLTSYIELDGSTHELDRLAEMLRITGQAEFSTVNDEGFIVELVDKGIGMDFRPRPDHEVMFVWSLPRRIDTPGLPDRPLCLPVEPIYREWLRLVDVQKQ